MGRNQSHVHICRQCYGVIEIAATPRDTTPLSGTAHVSINARGKFSSEDRQWLPHPYIM
jgi:hypothetical protein